jgi:hypothetical protein
MKDPMNDRQIKEELGQIRTELEFSAYAMRRRNPSDEDRRLAEWRLRLLRDRAVVFMIQGDDEVSAKGHLAHCVAQVEMDKQRTS